MSRVAGAALALASLLAAAACTGGSVETPEPSPSPVGVRLASVVSTTDACPAEEGESVDLGDGTCASVDDGVDLGSVTVAPVDGGGEESVALLTGDDASRWASYSTGVVGRTVVVLVGDELLTTFPLAGESDGSSFPLGALSPEDASLLSSPTASA